MEVGGALEMHDWRRRVMEDISLGEFDGRDVVDIESPLIIKVFVLFASGNQFVSIQIELAHAFERRQVVAIRAVAVVVA